MCRFFRKLYRIIILLLYLPLPWFIAFWNSFGGSRWDKIRRICRVTQLWASGLAKIIGLKITVHPERDPSLAGLIVANHSSYLDILVAGAAAPVRFMPKVEISRWPVLGSYLGMSRPLWVDRKSPVKSKKLIEDMLESIHENVPLIVYPEGTTGDGSKLKPFKSTAFQAVIDGGVPILPNLAIYRCDEMNVAWYGDMTLLPHVWKILGLREIEVDLYLLPPILPKPGEDRKELASRVGEYMAEEYLKRKSCCTKP